MILIGSQIEARENAIQTNEMLQATGSVAVGENSTQTKTTMDWDGLNDLLGGSGDVEDYEAWVQNQADNASNSVSDWINDVFDGVDLGSIELPNVNTDSKIGIDSGTIFWLVGLALLAKALKIF